MEHQLQIRVFIASSEDLAVERRAFKDTIDSLNRGFGRGADVEFVPLGWEDRLSQVGRRSQAHINDDIDECDVFVLAMWRQLGQPPPGPYDSYTEEVFHRALARYEKTGAPVMHVFFKHVDAEQVADPGRELTRVLRFRKVLESRKVLYQTFRDERDFASEVNRKLAALVQASAKLPAPQEAPKPARIVVPRDLVKACSTGECIAFVGSGVSARAGLPTWSGFVEGLVREAEHLGLMTYDNAAAQHDALNDGEINAVADNAASAFVKEPDALIAYYRRASSAATESLPPVYDLLTGIPFAGLVTSNYDDLLDRAYADTDFQRGLTPRDSERLLELLSAGRPPFLLKLYGDLGKPETVVLAPTDYRNLVRSNAAFARFIEALFFSRTLLFVGTSLEGLADYLSAFTFPSGVPRQHYALIAVSGRRWQAKAELLQRRYNIKVLSFPVSETFSEVDAFLADLAAATHATGQGAAGRGVATAPAATGPQLRRVMLRNIGPFRELELDLTESWKILLGDNGVGKSTILKAIAVAIVGSEARHWAARLLRAGETLGSVTLMTTKNPHGHVAEIQRVGSGAEVVSHGRALEVEGWVALGFPPLRTTSWKPTQGPQGMGMKRPSAEDLLPLVNGDVDARMDELKQWLVNNDALRRKEGAPEQDRRRAGEILDKFFAIVGTLTDGLHVRFREITSDFRVLVETDDGVLPLEALSQGMTSLLSWVGIVMQRLYEVHYDNPDVQDPTQEYALVLMDEIDAHMHPRWQQTLVSRLKRVFPHLQVLASTHSPLVVGGLSVSQVARFERGEDGVVAMVPVGADMLVGRADQILTGDGFGLETTFVLDDETKEMQKEYEVLLAKSKPTDDEKSRCHELHRKLADRIPPSPETKLERRAQELADAVLQASYKPADAASTKAALLDKAKAVFKSMGQEIHSMEEH